MTREGLREQVFLNIHCISSPLRKILSNCNCRLQLITLIILGLDTMTSVLHWQGHYDLCVPNDSKLQRFGPQVLPPTL